jgi:hypothetical protein
MAAAAENQTTRPSFRAGDLVMVRVPEEILATLDADGTLDGLPFMPEMLEWCGKPFRVQRRVEKTCVDVTGDLYPTRRFAANDVVMLDNTRCSGEGHDGCRRGCRIFWKEAWLRPADGAVTMTRPAALDALRARLKITSGESRYFCQSTELLHATEPFPGRQKLWAVRVALREIRNGDRSVPELVRLFTLWSWQRVRRKAGGQQWLRGPNTRTPSMSLNLQPGQAIRIKSRAEVVATLDRNRRNRGMGICYEVTRCCGGEAEVRDRVDRIIDERTGTMRHIADTVTLKMRGNPSQSEECLCFDEPGDCPRGELMYWREIWLERSCGPAEARVGGKLANWLALPQRSLGSALSSISTFAGRISRRRPGARPRQAG